jgi:purine-cytosine permease-like protein
MLLSTKIIEHDYYTTRHRYYFWVVFVFLLILLWLLIRKKGIPEYLQKKVGVNNCY